MANSSLVAGEFPARWSGERRAYIRGICIHTMETPESYSTARAVAQYFQRITTPASTHYCVDAREIIQCVPEETVAYAAPGVNHDFIQIECAGYAAQSPTEWEDEYSTAMLENLARLCADICRRHGIPATHLTDWQLAGGGHGIIGHVQASQVYRQSDHWDPGPNFPWQKLVSDINSILAGGVPGQQQPRKEENMYLICVDNSHWWVLQDGLAPHQITDWGTVQAFQKLGLERLNLSGNEFNLVRATQEAIAKPATAAQGRIKDIKDMLTGYKGMAPALKASSLLAGVAGKLGIKQ